MRCRSSGYEIPLLRSWFFKLKTKHMHYIVSDFTWKEPETDGENFRKTLPGPAEPRRACLGEEALWGGTLPDTDGVRQDEPFNEPLAREISFCEPVDLRMILKTILAVDTMV